MVEQSRNLQTCHEWWPFARLRQYIDVDTGIPVAFVFQLEYNHGADYENNEQDDWRQVARFDHQHGGEHDWREDGPHLDLYRDGHKYAILEDFGYIEIRQAPSFSRQFLEENHRRLLARYERWHDVDGSFQNANGDRR